MSEILPNLWLGPLGLTRDSEFLKENHISHVVTILEHSPKSSIMYELGIKSHYVSLYDNDDEAIGDHFEQCVAFIDDALKHGGAVYVHCFMGISRSPTIVAAYLMKTYKMTAEAALNHIRACRPCIDPNDGFRAALIAWQTKLL